MQPQQYPDGPAVVRDTCCHRRRHGATGVGETRGRWSAQARTRSCSHWLSAMARSADRHGSQHDGEAHRVCSDSQAVKGRALRGPERLAALRAEAALVLVREEEKVALNYSGAAY
jgi:hypothetical protein